MRKERMDGIASKNRNLSVEENLRLFNEMKNVTEIVSSVFSFLIFYCPCFSIAPPPLLTCRARFTASVPK